MLRTKVTISFVCPATNKDTMVRVRDNSDFDLQMVNSKEEKEDRGLNTHGKYNIHFYVDRCPQCGNSHWLDVANGVE